MKFNKILLITILTIVVNSCSVDGKVQDIKELEYIDAITIEENDNIIWNRISYIDIKGEKMLISDMDSYQSVLYSIVDGQLISNFSPSAWLSDSLMTKSSKYQVWCRDTEDSNSVWFLKLESLAYNLSFAKNKQDSLSILSKFKPSIMFSSLSANSENIYSLVKIFTTNEVYDKDWKKIDRTEFHANIFALVKTDMNFGIKSLSVLDTGYVSMDCKGFKEKLNRSIFPYSALITDDALYCHIRNEYADNIQDMDNLNSIGKFSLDGKFLGVASKLPQEFIDMKCYYEIPCLPNMAEVRGKVYSAYNYIDGIYDVSNNGELSFRLKDIPVTNESAFEYISENYPMSESILDITNNYFKFYLSDIFAVNDNIGVYCKWDTGKFENGNIVYEHIYQEYSTSGDLLKHIILDGENKNGKLSKLYFNNSDNQLLMLRYTEDDWRIEKYTFTGV